MPRVGSFIGSRVPPFGDTYDGQFLTAGVSMLIDNSIYTVHYYTYLYMIIIIEKENDDDDDDNDDTDQNDNDNLDDCNDIDDTEYPATNFYEHDSDTKRR